MRLTLQHVYLIGYACQMKTKSWAKKLQTKCRPSVDHAVDPNKDQAESAWSLFWSTTWSTPGLHLVCTFAHQLVFIWHAYPVHKPCLTSKSIFMNPTNYTHLKLQNSLRIHLITSICHVIWVMKMMVMMLMMMTTKEMVMVTMVMVNNCHGNPICRPCARQV